MRWKQIVLTTTLAGSLPFAVLAAPQGFDTPQTALDAVFAALQDRDQPALLMVFGPEAEDLILSGDEVEDHHHRDEFLSMYRQGFRFVPQDDGSVVIDLGADDWPFPIPLAQGDQGWSFDIDAGREEIVSRTIGRNELNVIALMDAYVDLQALFRETDQDGDGVMEFAQAIVSSADARDGLYWPGGDSLLGELAARAALDGFNDGAEDQQPEPHDGYYFRILDAQGDNAPGGAMDYIVNGNMVAGHALLAVPAEYGVTGVHSFIIAENGILLQADLGDETLENGFAIGNYDPTDEWDVATSE